MRRARITVFAAVLVLAASVIEPATVRIPNLSNQPVDPLQPSGAVKATVLLFISTECPYSNRSAPEIRRLYDNLTSKGVRFWLIYPNPAETPAIIRAHLKSFGYPDIALRDPRHELAKMAGTTVTPEAAVFNSAGLVYRGRIDDRFVELGRERPVATRHDLEDALALTLAGKPVSPNTTQAFGCFIADFK